MQHGILTHMQEKETTLNDLARMIANGFADTATKADIHGLSIRVDGVESRLDGVESRLGSLEAGQEEIKLRLDSLAYKFEVKELTRRVENIEKKVGIPPA